MSINSDYLLIIEAIMVLKRTAIIKTQFNDMKGETKRRFGINIIK